MKNKNSILFITQILFALFSFNLFIISISDSINDKYFCQEFENNAAKNHLTDVQKELIKNNFLNKIEFWNTPHNKDTSKIILAIYLYIFGLCYIPQFILSFVIYFYIQKRNLFYHIIFVVICIILMICPNLCVIRYTLRIIKPIRINNYFTNNKKFISLLDIKMIELNLRTIKMIIASLFSLLSMILLILELLFIVKYKKSYYNSKNINYWECIPILESERIYFKKKK